MASFVGEYGKESVYVAIATHTSHKTRPRPEQVSRGMYRSTGNNAHENQMVLDSF